MNAPNKFHTIRAFAEQVAAFLRNYDVAVRQPDGSAAFVRLDRVAEEVLKMAAAYEAEGPSAEHSLLFTCPLGDGLKFAFHTQEQVDMIERHLKVAHGREWISVRKRLPPDGEPVLVFSRYWCANPFVARLYHGEWDGEQILSRPNSVTHWMPLPSAPQQESEEPMCHCGQPLSAHRIGGGAEHDFIEQGADRQ